MHITHLLGSYRRHLLCTTMCCLVVVASAGDAFAGFDPDAGKEESAPIASQSLARKRTAPTPMMMINRAADPLYPTADRGYVKAVDEVEMPKPLYPARSAAPVAPIQSAETPIAQEPPPIAQEIEVAATAIAPLPNEVTSTIAPPPEAATQAEPSGEMQMAGYIAPPPPMPNIVPMTSVSQPTAVITSDEGAPVDIVAPNDPRLSTGKAMNSTLSVGAPPPVMGSPAPAPTAQYSSLSSETKEILGRIPARVGSQPPERMSRTMVDRVSPEVSQLIPNLEKDAEYESVGLKISVSRHGFDSAHELNRAYEALIAGDSERAVDIYQDIIAAEPQNQDALFGLAATYHRAGELARARPLYGALLRINPEHREALNNFLVLVSDEAPQEALFELQKLADRNPDFSPIRAQMAIVLEKLGQHDMAHEQMVKAIRMSPENLVYKYNLAVMMDRQGRYADAAALYGLLVDAALRGEAIPAPLEDIQKRMNYIQTASLDMTRGG